MYARTPLRPFSATRLHFVSLQDTSVAVIDKTDLRIATKHEDYWIHTLQIKSSMWLNAEGGYGAVFLYCFCTTIFFLGFGQLVLG